MKHVLLLLLDTYRILISPAIHTLVPVRSGCRFPVSCSTYCREAVHTHGVGRGLRLGFQRVAQCHPFGNDK